MGLPPLQATTRPRANRGQGRMKAALSRGGAWVLLALLWCLHWLPLPVLAAMGRGLGTLLYRVGGSRRRIGRRNLQLCMPDKPPAEREALLREHIEAKEI